MSIARGVLVVGFVIQAGCGKGGDWSASRDAYCAALTPVGEEVTRRLDAIRSDLGALGRQLKQMSVAGEDRAARYQRRLERCARIEGEIHAVTATLRGFHQGAAAVHAGHGKLSLAEAGLTETGFGAEDLARYDMKACNDDNDEAAAKSLQEITKKVSGEFAAATAACAAKK